jgi:hypothetical protein
MKKAIVIAVLTVVAPLCLFADDLAVKVARESTMYDILAGRPEAERKVLYRALQPEAQAALWRVHLSRFVEQHPDLNSYQRELIARFEEFLTAETFAAPAGSDELRTQVREPLDRLQDAVRIAFPAELAEEAFTRIGPADEPLEFVPGGGFERHGITRRGGRIETNPCQGCGTGGVPDCSCSLSSDWCGIGSYCGGSTCYPAEGCGFMLRYLCDSQCRPNP